MSKDRLYVTYALGAMPRYVVAIPYIGLNDGKKWPSQETVEELAVPLLRKIEAELAKVRQATENLQHALAEAKAAGMEGLPSEQDVRNAMYSRLDREYDKELVVYPTEATGQYTIDPFVGWSARVRAAK